MLVDPNGMPVGSDAAEEITAAASVQLIDAAAKMANALGDVSLTIGFLGSAYVLAMRMLRLDRATAVKLTLDLLNGVYGPDAPAPAAEQPAEPAEPHTQEQPIEPIGI